MKPGDHDSYRARRRARLARQTYGVSGPSDMPTLSPTQFGAENSHLTYATDAEGNPTSAANEAD